MTARVVLLSTGERWAAWESACARALVEAGAELAGRLVIQAPHGGRVGGRPPSSETSVPPETVGGLTPSLTDPAAARALAPDMAVAFDERLADAAVAVGAESACWFAFGGSVSNAPIGALELQVGAGALFAALVGVDGASAACIRRGWFPVTAHSYGETVDAARFGAARWPAQVLRERAAGLPDVKTPLAERSAEGARADERFSSASFAARMAFASIAARLRYLFRHEHWNIGVADRPIDSFVERPSTGDVRWLPRPPRGSFIADPFGCVQDGTTYLFCEGFDYRDQTGYLASAALDAGKPGAPLVPFYRPPTHCSYPFVVQQDGQTYCIPETSQAGEVALWRATELPGRWERVATLLHGFAACDPSVVYHDGAWWMFCTDADAPNHELHVFHAERLTGPWRAHARNPVKIDVRSARPAGTPFVHDGALLRPGQDCAGGYGRRVVLNRVLALTPFDYHEEAIARVAPDPSSPYREGVHTLSAAGPRTLVDGKYARFVPSQCWSVLRGYGARALGRGRA